MNEGMYLGNQALALRVISQALWTALLFAVVFSCTAAWLVMALRAKTARSLAHPFLINGLTAITLLVVGCGGCYLFALAVEPSAFLQSVMGPYCFPPTPYQLFAPVLACGVTALVYASVHRHGRAT